MFSFTFASQAQSYELNVVTSLSQSDPMYEGLLEFKRLIESRSQQSMTVRIFVGSQLGNDDDVLEQAMAGTNVAVLVDGGRLSMYSHELGILGAPYLVSNTSQLKKLVVSPLFNEWSNTLAEQASLRILAFNWWQGARHLLTQKAVSNPNDLQGVRMRTIGAPVWISTIAAMGATPTPLSWAEVYSGLQQKVIDAGEAQFSAVWGARLYEVISHITKTGHIQLISGLVTSDDWFNNLPASMQSLVLQAAFDAGDFASNLVSKNETRVENALRDAGVLVEAIDTGPFEQATQSVYEALGYTSLREQVKTTIQQDKP